jgi:hypothetical protein
MASRRSSFGFRALITSVIITFLSTVVPVHAQTIDWVRQFGTNRRDEGQAIAKGPTGVYITGNTVGVFPGQTSVALNDVDVFVSRYDEQGNAIWSRQFGSATVSQDDGTGVATDQTGVYVVGWTHGALPGETSVGSTDAFIRKYSPDGTVLWTRQFGTPNQDEAHGVATDGTGVYVVGHTQGNLVPNTQAGSSDDAFIRRYDANGTLVWTRQFGTIDNERAIGVAMDSTGIYVAGPTAGNLGTRVGGRDGFLRKFDAGGNALWTRQYGTNTTDDVFAVAAGGLGIYVGGDTTGTFPGQTKVAGGLYDAYVIKFDVSGNQQWVREFGTRYEDWTLGLAVTAGSVVVAAHLDDSLTTQPWTGSGAVVFFDFDGNMQPPPIQFGNGVNDNVNGVAADVTGVYVGGTKQGNALNQVSLGDLDAFVMKITAPLPTSLPFSITNFTGISTTTDGSGSLSVGHARIETTAGTTPSGVAIFGYRPAGVLVTEAGVPDSPLITSGRIYGEVSATAVVNTGLAIANPNDQAAAITFTLTDATGTAVKSGSRTINPREQVAEFLNEPPYSSDNGFQGTLSFTSTVPVGVIALRSLVNERSDFLITTLPVIDLSQPVSTGTQVVPHFAVGDGWGTQIILVNPTDSAQTGNVQFLGPGSGSTPAAAVTVNIDGTAGSSAAYSVAPRSSRKFVITPAAAGLSYGSVRIVPASAGPSPTPLVVFGYKPGAFTFSEAGVPVTMGTAFRMYVEASGAPVILSGVAIANTTTTPATVTLELMTLSGAPVGVSASRTIPASGQIAGYLNDFFPSLPLPFQGVLRVSTPSGGVSVVALRQRYNERGDYLITTTPPTLETRTPTTAARSFPHFVNGDGYTTQFILFSGTAGQTAAGSMRFYRQNGNALPVSLR